MHNKPNFIFIISHDTGRSLGAYGYNVSTPNIDKFAKESIQFNNYFCPAPQCSPSRSSIITGLYPHNNGLMGLAHKGFAIKEGIKTLQMYLKDADYETTLIGLSHETIEGEKKGLSSSTYRLGYENYIEIQGNRAEKVVDAFESFMNKRKNNKPFYISLGFEETHRSFDEYEADADKPEEVSIFEFLEDTEGLRKDISLFNGSIKVLDRAFGRVYNHLKANNMLDNTYIILTTDHGIAFPRCKGTLRDSGLETLLIMRTPFADINGEINQLLCNVDMMPTILELAKIEIPKNLDGISFVSLLKGENQKIRDEFFCEMTWHDRYYPARGIRTESFKYIQNLSEGPKVYMPADIYDTESGKSLQTEYDLPNEKEELYDLVKDPLEMLNVAQDPEYSHILSELREKVEKWMISTNDPILIGKIEGEESLFWKKIRNRKRIEETTND